MAKDEVVVGRIAGVFGLRGELKCDPTSAGRILFVAGAELRCAASGETWQIVLSAVRPHRGRLLISIDDVDDASTAQRYVGAVVTAPRASIALGPGEYLDDDLIGCNVRGLDGTEYGAVERVEHYPASDMLVVAGRMVPMVAAIVVDIALERRTIAIDPPTGLLD
ncbi:MAG: 16S rRNA processing protein RimM [Candidatus Eremiobacteraeota bacterium]|nr:16S rRNA processing protein RimM [Candidatus Eremiobacteraeota bacterium]